MSGFTAFFRFSAFRLISLLRSPSVWPPQALQYHLASAPRSGRSGRNSAVSRASSDVISVPPRPHLPPHLFIKRAHGVKHDMVNSRVRRRTWGVGGLPRTRAAMASALASVLAVLSTFPRASRAHTGASKLSLVQQPTVALDPDITLVVGPTLLFESGEWVTVSWTGIEAWRFPDAFVAAFSPGTALDDQAALAHVAPVKYQFLTAGKPFPGDGDGEGDVDVGGAGDASFETGIDEESAAGRGKSDSSAGRETVAAAAESLRFRLLNLRDAEGYRFGLFKGGVEEPVLVAKTEEAVAFAQPFEVGHWHVDASAQSPR